jgi:hypothetical protein
MTANLRTLTKEKRESPMKRFLMPATVLAAIKKIALAILCVTLLMIVAAPAWADPCTAPTLGPAATGIGTATGCGAVITVTAVNGGVATAFTVTSVSGTGNPFDTGLDDTLVGIQNNSTGTLNSINLSSPLTTPDSLFNFETNPPDGVCAQNGDDCFLGESGTGYEGPHNTFIINGDDLTKGTVCFNCAPYESGIPPSGSTWFALEGTPQSLTSISQTQTLHPGVQVIYPAGNDNIKFTPFNNVGGELLTITAVPVPQSAFGTPVGFPGETCVPYKDFSDAAHVPTCVEFQADCSQGTASTNDCSTFLFQTVTNYDLPADLPAIGGPDYLIFHGKSAPLTDFSGGQSIFTEYGVLRLDPYTKGGSGGTGTVFVATFHTSATPITSGTTDTFLGFQSPVSNTSNNVVKAGSTVPLKWRQFDTSGNPVTNLSLCTAFTVSNPDPPVCTAPSGVSAPWVNVQAVKVPGVTCAADPGTNILTSFAGNSGLQNQGNGNYQFNWKTSGIPAGSCLNIVFTYSSGAVIVTPPEFQLK